MQADSTAVFPNADKTSSPPIVFNLPPLVMDIGTFLKWMDEKEERRRIELQKEERRREGRLQKEERQCVEELQKEERRRLGETACFEFLLATVTSTYSFSSPARMYQSASPPASPTRRSIPRTTAASKASV